MGLKKGSINDCSGVHSGGEEKRKENVNIKRHKRTKNIPGRVDNSSNGQDTLACLYIL